MDIRGVRETDLPADFLGKVRGWSGMEETYRSHYK